MKKYILFFTLFLWTVDGIAGPKHKHRNPPNAHPASEPSKELAETTWEDVKPKTQEPTPACPPNSLRTFPERPHDSLGSRQSAHSSPLEPERSESPNHQTINPGTPRFSAEEIKRVQKIQETEAQLSKELKLSLEEGWITFTEHDAPAQAKPISQKSWLEQFAELPKAWWQEHVTDKNRVEHFMRYAGLVRTYVILLQKHQTHELDVFIKDLNESNDGEGNRWLDEALVHAIKDEREDTTRKIMTFAIPYKEGLTPLTRALVYKFLITRADMKQKALAQDHEDYAHDMNALARVIQATTNIDPEIPEISVEILEESARATALTLTKCATGGYLPKLLDQK